MTLGPTDILEVDTRMNQLFALVSEALAAATHALLSSDSATGLAVIVSDQSVDDLTAEVELLVWKQIDGQTTVEHDPPSTGGCAADRARAGTLG